MTDSTSTTQEANAAVPLQYLITVRAMHMGIPGAAEAGALCDFSDEVFVVPTVHKTATAEDMTPTLLQSLVKFIEAGTRNTKMRLRPMTREEIAEWRAMDDARE